MKVLLTGNKGYIGAVLVDMLLERSYEVIGYDTDYYNACELYEFNQPIKQINKDIRDVSIEDLEGVDAVIHLAALSNDPLGELAPQLTESINFEATLKLARLAKQASVGRFIYASSQSMYGISNVGDELDEDNSDKNPLTAYARTKWQAECTLKEMGTDDFTVVCFRPSTVFGASPKLRCDIVFNNLVACAYTTGTIEIKSNGSPWRPVIHVRDVSSAFIAGLAAPAELVSNQSFNVGIEDGNYTVRQLAQAAQKAVPGSTLVFIGEHGQDSRTYKVSFNKILTVLKDYFKPRWNLASGGKELVDMFKRINFSHEDFKGRKCVRLKSLERLIEEGMLDRDLRWLLAKEANTGLY